MKFFRTFLVLSLLFFSSLSIHAENRYSTPGAVPGMQQELVRMDLPGTVVEVQGMVYLMVMSQSIFQKLEVNQQVKDDYVITVPENARVVIRSASGKEVILDRGKYGAWLVKQAF